MLRMNFRYIENSFRVYLCPIKNAFQAETSGVVFTQLHIHLGVGYIPLLNLATLGPDLTVPVLGAN